MSIRPCELFSPCRPRSKIRDIQINHSTKSSIPIHTTLTSQDRQSFGPCLTTQPHRPRKSSPPSHTIHICYPLQSNRPNHTGLFSHSGKSSRPSRTGNDSQLFRTFNFRRLIALSILSTKPIVSILVCIFGRVSLVLLVVLAILARIPELACLFSLIILVSLVLIVIVDALFGQVSLECYPRKPQRSVAEA